MFLLFVFYSFCLEVGFITLSSDDRRFVFKQSLREGPDLCRCTKQAISILSGEFQGIVYSSGLRLQSFRAKVQQLFDASRLQHT